MMVNRQNDTFPSGHSLKVAKERTVIEGEFVGVQLV